MTSPDPTQHAGAHHHGAAGHHPGHHPGHGGHGGEPSVAVPDDVERFWEDLYRPGPRWSGNPNPALVDVASPLPPGTALDLGCGEGGDALWLAGRGWRVTAVDVSATALERLAASAAAAGLAERLEIGRHDLTASFPDGAFDLVCACYLHSPVPMDRDRVLHRAAQAVAPGGVLIVVDHEWMSPWSWTDADAASSAAPQVLDALGLDPAEWRTSRAGAPRRGATTPDGEAVTVTDLVLALTRRAS
ncbi:bifunctional 2-polyprenyl-6-hydroxyphenol methylase/3-demethylubiquinol 3-O-methyltransferase UbiG [Quadrisphaera sp. DSM 44207]|uniref:class I SAM-dependent methyltransferase n=1 Tax=Quadrisphaera sp. DSM 44207 TaxID=1881057 RepID=UPI000884057D|nr:class I SAM-dependent methyltransferase [Quadrisphaera sp. DSM 44207]SDQ21293.1 Methyltransferase domain-containing protein [Quadrisphaera sp. DSM 44207]